MLVCPDYDVMIVSDRIYYRIVIPQDLNTNCNYSGVDVIVVFVAFSGVDSQELLLPVAQGYNMSVHFGLPRLSMTVLSVPNKDPVLLSYLLFVQRIIQSNNKKFKQYPLVGYFWSDDVMLPDVNKPTALQTNYGKLFSELHLLLHENHKTFGLTSLVNTNKLLSGIPSTDHVKAFSTLARFCDIISVKDGQGSGTSGLFWVTQRSQVISKADPGLFAVLREQLPVLSTNTTYEQVFWNSISEVFDALADARDALQNKSVSVDLWLNIEVYDVLHTDPCLPVDEQASGLDRMLNPIKKSRVDSVLTAAGTAPQKVVAMAWDPSFTCVTDSQPAPLRTQVRADMGRPVIAHCSMHSSFNRSVVVIGYNLDGLQQMYTIDWPNANGQRTKSNVYGYYFELDWGSQHQRVPSLMYVQTFDPYDVTKLAPRGVVRVQAGNSYHACVFEYDFTKADDDNRLQKHESRVAKKKYVRVKNEPYRRIEAQDSKF
ncbi:hypothetical protein DPMN_053019 [Dreissena polymorpha]|nr:hypothetical protein DPMN_053019 [Dreissena polymorpha]